MFDKDIKTDDVMDLFIEDGVITKRGKNIKKKAEKTIDAKGLYVMPGLVDMHVHLRDPGFTHKGDVETETRSAARGGYTTVLAMPNTKPVVDNADVVRYVHHKAECARLQGFPDWWCAGLGTDKPTEEEIEFWTEVFETHRSVMGTSSKPKSRNQIIKWLKNPHSDSAEYKMWGNGVALPNVYFVLSGIVYYSQFPDFLL